MTDSPGPAAQLIVLAKEPVPGTVKTRLCPPLSTTQAAELATAALQDTLRAVARTPAARPVLALSGRVGRSVPPSYRVLRQRGAGLDERIAAAFNDAWQTCPLPMLLVGMDTPQLHPALLSAALASLLCSGTDAVLGLADDGGWWALGLRRPDPDLLLGVAMSTDHTGADQRARLQLAGLSVGELATLRDVDTIDDAYAVARAAPGSRFAAALQAVPETA